MASDPDRHRLPEDEHQRIFERDIVPALFAGARTVARPVAVVFGGQPGAGKSAAVDAVVLELEPRGGAVQIIGDELRSYHPHYAELMARDDKTAAFHTDRDSGHWVEKAIRHAKDLRVNLVIEGTMRDSSKVAITMTSLRQAGYEIDARALAVNERLSWQGVMQRYEAQHRDRGAGRMTAPQAHQAAYDGMPVTLERVEEERLADRVSLYRRGGQVIYANELVNGHWRQPPRARDVLEAERRRPPTLDERRAYAEGFDTLHGSLAKPGRHATPAEVQAMDELRERAHREWRAAVFRELPAEQALRSHPELASAYDVLRAIDAQAASQGQTPEQRRGVQAQAHERMAQALERGELPAFTVREPMQSMSRPPGLGIERDR